MTLNILYGEKNYIRNIGKYKNNLNDLKYLIWCKKNVVNIL